MTDPFVLTTASSILCSHGFGISAGNSGRLKVGGKEVLLAGLAGKSFTCSIPDNPNTGIKHCTKVSTVSAGEKSRLTVGKVSVLLDVLVGLTDGAPPPPNLVVVPKQARLRAAVKP